MLPKESRDEALSGMTDRQARDFLYDWRGFWARENQLPPAGDWTNWLVLAGRGFGKTRTGAETVREWASQPLPGPIHLVAPTAADIRKVMIEGPNGGLLSCYPPGQAPHYEPSKGHLLTWPNGNLAYCFSADEPERLRGPQCLSGDSRVLMADGASLEMWSIRAGDQVMTRNGPRQVRRAWMASDSASVFRLVLLDGRSILATGGQRICVTPASNGTDELGTRDQAEATTRPESCYTGKSGRERTDRYRQGTIFITVTEIFTIIASRTSNCSPVANIAECTAEKSSNPTKTSLWRQREKPVPAIGRFGLERESLSASCVDLDIAAGPSGRPLIAPQNALSGCGPGSSPGRIVHANIAGSYIDPLSACNATVPATVMPQHAPCEKFPSGTLLAVTAAYCSPANEVMGGFAQGHAALLSMERIVSVEALSVQIPVYDLEIEGEPEFFANGVLVHNCCRFWADELASWRFGQEAWDNLMFGFRVGDELRSVITTTPKPIKLLKSILSDQSTVVTRGSTYDNRHNLSSQFFRQVITKYEGTRLGRQELNAELLEDIPGALWTMGMIDSTRITLAEIQWDRIVRIVVAIDPSVTASESSNETGIVVAALTISGHVIVLDDLSGKMSPADWGRVAVNAYLSRRADRIIGESNNGGDLVEGNIRAVNAGVPYRAVHASRGKRRRAEPVSALYEQGRVHHVGTFSKMEEQMCSYVPGVELDGDSDSPDRMDALVWAVTELVVDPPEQFQRIVLNPRGSYQISPI